MQQCIRVQPHTANSEQTLIYKQQKLAAPLALQKIVSKPVGSSFSLTFVQKFWYNVGRSIGVWSIHVRSRVGQSICVGMALARQHSINLESTLTFSRVGGWVGGVTQRVISFQNVHINILGNGKCCCYTTLYEKDTKKIKTFQWRLLTKVGNHFLTLPYWTI